MKLFAHVLALGVVMCAAGCSSDNGPVRPPSPPADPYTAANSPDAAFARYAQTYADRNVDAFGATLTADFRYYFSAQSDPVLVQEYGHTWDRDAETTSAGHLFAGFTNDQGAYQPAAARILLNFLPVAALSDTAHADSTNHYKRLAIPVFVVNILLENDNGFDVSSPFDVYVVRGDAAVLGPGQPADTTHWYVRRIDDLAAPLTFAASRHTVLKPATRFTWGAIRSIYLQ